MYYNLPPVFVTLTIQHTLVAAKLQDRCSAKLKCCTATLSQRCSNIAVSLLQRFGQWVQKYLDKKIRNHIIASNESLKATLLEE